VKVRVIKSPAVSIRARLLNHAKLHGDDYQRVLTRYAIERLLFRLGNTAATDSYVLKGAMLFVTWPEHVFRPTGDLDLLGRGNPRASDIAEIFTGVCRVDLPEDGIKFDVASLKVEEVREAGKYQGIQVSVKGELAQAIVTVWVDIGFGDYVYPAPKRGTFPGILPDLPQASVLMYPPESVIAEKFEAMIRFGEANGRLKDFHDIWIVTRTFPFDLSALVEAISGTLQRRETAFPITTPVALTEKFAAIVHERGLWTGFLRRNPPTLTPPPFEELQAELRRFFGPIITALGEPDGANGQWDPNAMAWR
jgi:hypothetical protein